MQDWCSSCNKSLRFWPDWRHLR